MLHLPGNQLRGWILSTYNDSATLMREGIRAMYYNEQKYPVIFKMKNTEAVRSTFPTSMLTGVSRKQWPLTCWQGHTITQAVRPRSVIAPIVFGLGSELEQVFGSKWFLDQLNSLWFSISYGAVSLSEHNESLLLITVQTILILTTIKQSSSFHGIIRWSRSKLNFQKTETRIRRRARNMISDLVDPNRDPPYRLSDPNPFERML